MKTNRSNLILDLGGVMTDDSDRPLIKVLSLSPERVQELNKVLYLDARWSEEVMLGTKTMAEYREEIIGKYPEFADEIYKCLALEWQPKTLPVYVENLAYFRKLKPEGWKIYFLSNLTLESYEYLKPILDEFDGGAYSCLEHLKKPDPRFYQRLFDKYSLKPEECIFFDDNEKNVEAGNNLGMESHVFTGIDGMKEVLKGV